jgi:putative transposase
MHRGNNKQDIFECVDDILHFKEDLALSLSKANCHLHAYVIMSNHIHLLLTPVDQAQLTKFMQSVANRYVRYFNAKNQRTGTIWEGRYKSCLVDSDNYFLALHKYIELNPVKAGMKKKAADYRWSSYRYNALGEADNLITEHEVYTGLGKTHKQRNTRYRQLFRTRMSKAQEQEITTATMRGEVYGSERFHHKISRLVERVTKLGAHGGDRKSEYFVDQAG